MVNVGGAIVVSVSPITAQKELTSDCETEIGSVPAKVLPTESGFSISEFRDEGLKTCNEGRTS